MSALENFECYGEPFLAKEPFFAVYSSLGNLKRRVLQNTPYSKINSNVIFYNYIVYNNYQCDLLPDLLKLCNKLFRKLKLPLQITEEHEALTSCIS